MAKTINFNSPDVHWIVLRCDPVETLAGVAIGGRNGFAVCGMVAFYA
jgi:hypothetical protein